MSDKKAKYYFKNDYPDKCTVECSITDDKMPKSQVFNLLSINEDGYISFDQSLYTGTESVRTVILKGGYVGVKSNHLEITIAI